MKKMLILIVLLPALFAMPVPAIAGSTDRAITVAVAPVTLNASTVVNSDVIYLGDLFDGVGEKAHIVIAYAPQPGKRSIFDARWLVYLARQYGLDWQPVTPRVSAVVERDTYVIGREEIEERIMAAIVEREANMPTNFGLGDDMRVSLSNRILRMYLPAESIGKIGVESVDVDPISGRFSATIVAPEGDPSAQRHRVTGVVQKMIAVPVLTDRLHPGDIIRKENLKIIWMPAGKVKKDILTDTAQLINKSSRRGIKPGYPIRVSEVRDPILVPRGDLVTILLRLPNMTLTSQGRALENGSEGDVVRIQNTQSNKTIQATVTGESLVTVRLATQELAMRP